MESIGTLASGIAHDFNNVLNNVLGFAAQLKKYVHDETKVLKYIETIERSAQRGAELASQLLSFARTSRRHSSPTDLTQIVREVLASCRETFPSSVTMEERIDKDLIVELRSQGKTVLLSSHILAEVEALCDRERRDRGARDVPGQRPDPHGWHRRAA